MEFKVRALDVIEPKSVQEVETELLEKHESEQQQEVIEETKPDVEVHKQDDEELDEQKVLSYIGKRYNKQINSLDDLAAERSAAEQLPEDVSEYMKYRKETGRGFEDFLKLKKDFDSMDQDTLLKEYIKATQDGIDDDDVEVLMDEYRYDEDLDDESKIKRVKIEKKKAITEAKKFFNSQKEKYKLPLESSVAGLSKEEKEEYDAYRQYIQQSKTFEEENNRKRKWFEQKTDEIFGQEFKGFEFAINDKKFSFAPGDATELKRIQSTPANFINKFLDDNGMIKDAVGYHRSLAIAMNPDKFAKFFYEQGLSDATEDVMRKTKNINMSERRAPEIAKTRDGFQVKAVNPDSGRSLKISSIKRI